MRDSVSSWTASTPEDQEGVGGATGTQIGPQRLGASAQSRPAIGPAIGPSFKVEDFFGRPSYSSSRCYHAHI